MSIQPDRIGMNGPIVGRRVATVIVGGVLALILCQGPLSSPRRRP